MRNSGVLFAHDLITLEREKLFSRDPGEVGWCQCTVDTYRMRIKLRHSPAEWVPHTTVSFQKDHILHVTNSFQEVQVTRRSQAAKNTASIGVTYIGRFAASDARPFEYRMLHETGALCWHVTERVHRSELTGGHSLELSQALERHILFESERSRCLLAYSRDHEASLSAIPQVDLTL